MKLNKQFLWNGLVVSFSYDDKCLCIVDSYRFNKSDMFQILQIIRDEVKEDNIIYSRSIDSWIEEWAAHNVLYAMHIARKRTGSVDLNEDESNFKLFCYKILARFCK